MADAPDRIWARMSSKTNRTGRVSVIADTADMGTSSTEYVRIDLASPPDSRAQLAAAGALVEVKALLDAVKRAKQAFQNQDEFDLVPMHHLNTVRGLVDDMDKALGPFGGEE